MLEQTLYERISRRGDELAKDAARFLSEMIRIPSFSGDERAVVALIRAEMERVGMDEVHVDGLGNVIGRLGSGPQVIAFDAHIDTVLPGARALWEREPLSGALEGGFVHGRGAADQEGGMAAMVAAARIIREFDLGRELTVLFTGTVQEEDCDGLCWRYLIEEEGLRPQLVVITEPTSLLLYRGQRGRMEIAAHVTGRSCHGSAPERGINAVYKLARVALELERLNEVLPSDPFLGKGTLVVSEISSSSPSLCAVPDRASLYIDRRLTAGETAACAINEIRAAAARAGVPELDIEVPTYATASYTGKVFPMEKSYPAWTLSPDSPWLSHAAEVYRGVFGKAPIVDKWTFSTNGVAIAGLHGIPCFGLGPGDEEQAHAPNERCPVADLGQAAAFYAGLVARLGARP